MENNLVKIDLGFGLDDCDLLYCRYDGANVHMNIRTWNYLEVKIVFNDCILLLFLVHSSIFFSNLCQYNKVIGEFKEVLIDYFNGKIPQDQPYKYYCITDSLDDPLVKIVCKKIEIISIVNLLEIK